MHRRFFLGIPALVLAVLLFAGCVPNILASPQPQDEQPSHRERRKGANPEDQKREINVNGAQRQYLLYVPHSADKNHPLPLLLVFHGGGGHDYNMPRFTGFDEIADAHRFIVAYPDSVNRHWNDGRELSPADDVGFIRALISDVDRSYAVDAKHIYATGISNGGFFSQRLACDLADRITAVASVAATIPEPLVAICKPSRPVSVMFLQGTDDPLVHIEGGSVAKTHGRNLSLADSVRFWIDHDGTSTKPDSSDLPHHDPNGTSVHRDVYVGGKQDTEVVVYTIRGGGHTWPGGDQYLPVFIVGKVNHDIDASQVIWEFFSRHSR